MKKLLPFIATVMLGVPLFTAAQQSSKEDKSAVIQGSLEKKQYTFVARSAMPLRGDVRQLNSEYSLRISGDSVIADLPYFGRAFTAPMNMTGSGIQFISANNQYTSVAKKKGGWEISIKPLEQQDVRQLNLSVFANGSATLQVSNNNRDPISFNGYVVVK